jgi:hypothetical protein
MSSIWQRARLAFSAFWQTFTDPESDLRDMPTESRVMLYAQAWAYYRSKMFSRRDGVDWTFYLNQRELYKHTQLVYNPVPQIVDFYVDNIWQPARDDEYESLVTPVSDKTDDELRLVIAQIDQWSSFLSEAQKIKRYGSATGNVLVEGVDDLERQKVLHRTVWPGYVTDLKLNSTGDVLGYTVEFPVTENGRTWKYKKVVTPESWSYFKDNAPFIPEGRTAAVEDNPYGFVFAVWIRQTDDGGDYGAPACKDFDKVDELNELASHLHDNIHRTIESPKLIGASGEIVPIVGASSRVNPTTGVTEVIDADPRLNWVVLKANSKDGAVTVGDLDGTLKLAEAHPYLQDLLKSFTDDYPELQASSIVRDNSQLSGAALERMLGPAQNRLDGVQAHWNRQLIKLRQMQIAVGGMRYNSGDWPDRTVQQQAFAPFNLDSYERGLLEFSLRRSVLVQTTEMEREELKLKKLEVAKSVKEITTNKNEILGAAGYSEDEIAEVLAGEPDEPKPPTVIPNTLPENRQLEAVN